MLCVVFRTCKKYSLKTLGRLPEILFIDLLKLKKGVRTTKNSLAVGVSRKTESPYKDNQTNEKILQECRYNR